MKPGDGGSNRGGVRRHAAVGATRSPGRSASTPGRSRRSAMDIAPRPQARRHHHPLPTPDNVVDMRARRIPSNRRTVGSKPQRLVRWMRPDARRSSSVWRAGRPRRRLLTIFAIAAVFLAAAMVRIGLLQTRDSASYSEFGAAQRTRAQVLPADRGVIFDRDGEELVITVPATTFYADPRRIDDPATTAAALAQILGLTPEQTTALASDLAKPRDFVYVARQLDDQTSRALQAMRLKGVGWYDEPTRLFPAGDVARSLLGKTNIDGEGLAGLEWQYDDLLSGVDGEVIREIDGEGRSIVAGRREQTKPVPGQDLVLTISRPLQYQAEQALIAKVAEIGARGGTVIVMDSRSGELYALANVLRDEESGEVRVSSANLAAVESNEPGSVAKVIAVAGAMNEGTITPDKVFQVPGCQIFKAKPKDIKLCDASKHDTEDMTVDQILGKSSNLGTYRVMQTIGTKRHEEYMRAFGLGERTALEFKDEQRGIVHRAEDYQGTEAVTVAWGQGVSATSLQMVAAVNVIANDGTYVAPKLVKAVIDDDAVYHEAVPAETHPVISPAAATDMRQVMQTVVCKGTGKEAQIPGYDIAGKTGTSYKPQPNGTYKDKNGNFVYYASFVGFFPADNPQVTVLVSIDEPPAGGARYGGTVAAPVFTEVAQAAIHQLRIAPPGTGGCPS